MVAERMLAMFSTALEMEEKGKAFYERAVEVCKNDLGREIFASLLKDETIHVERIKSIYAGLKDGKSLNEDWRQLAGTRPNLGIFFNELKQRHAGMIRADTDDLKALDVGIGFEQKSINYYESGLKDAENPLERKFLELMILEEKGHFLLLKDTKYYLENPEAYFAEKEHSNYDAG